MKGKGEKLSYDELLFVDFPLFEELDMEKADNESPKSYNNEVVTVWICKIIHSVIFWVLDSSKQVCINNN